MAGMVADNSAKKGYEILDCALARIGVPTGIRTRVTGVKGRCPWPLDDGDR